MSKRQSQQQPDVLADLQPPPGEGVEHDENPNFFEHLIEDFQEMMSDKQVLRGCVQKFIDNLVDEFTLGIIFDLHRKHKTNAYCLEVESGEEEEESNKTEPLQPISVKNNQKCICPNCERPVAPLRFDRHLAKCMGVSDTSRSSLRNASRQVAANKDKEETSAYAGVASDDDDDEDWNARKNNKKKDKNGRKKSRGTPKKNVDKELGEPVNVDIEGSYDEATNLRYMMDHGPRRSYVVAAQERRSDSSSPTEGASTSTTPKKRDKSKKKSRSSGTAGGKDKGSPSTSLSFD